MPILPPRTLDVYAAASLREAFGTVALAFEQAHPGVKVRLTFAGSQTLAAQIANGAPADLFASAAAKNLDGVAYDPKSRRVFAVNRLVVASSGARIDLRGLAGAGRIVLAAPAVPAGGYAERAIAAAGKSYGAAWLAAVRGKVVSREADVRAVLTKVRLGEADAGIVYASDVVGAGKGIAASPLPAAFQPRIEYPVAVLRDARERALAEAFVHLLLAPTGQRALAAQGFLKP